MHTEANIAVFRARVPGLIHKVLVTFAFLDIIIHMSPVWISYLLLRNGHKLRQEHHLSLPTFPLTNQLMGIFSLKKNFPSAFPLPEHQG